MAAAAARVFLLNVTLKELHLRDEYNPPRQDWTIASQKVPHWKPDHNIVCYILHPSPTTDEVYKLPGTPDEPRCRSAFTDLGLFKGLYIGPEFEFVHLNDFTAIF